MGTSKSPRRCRNCGHDVDHHTGPACQRCRAGRRCSFFRTPYRYLEAYRNLDLTPEPRVPALLVCLHGQHRIGRTDVITYPDLDAALAAQANHDDPVCEGYHMIVFFDDGGHHILDTHPPPTPLAVELERCYPRPRFTVDYGPQAWPLDPELNRPLQKALVASDLPERIERGKQLAAAQVY